VTDEEDDDDPTPWTAEGAAKLRLAAQHLIAAIAVHAELVASTTGREQLPDVLAATEVLLPAVLAYADAQADYAQYAFPFGVLHQYAYPDGHEDDDDDPDDEDAGPTVGVSVLQRRDYRVLDEPAVLSAARAAYLRVWAGDNAGDAQRDVTDLGRALYQLAHADGWNSLDHVAGLQPTGAYISVSAQDQLLDRDVEHWPQEMYAPQGEILYTQQEVFP
jgi:hypothetical protein